MTDLDSINRVFSILAKHHNPTMLEQFQHFTPFQQLVATLLSSRTKDSTTIPIVKEMFKRYPEPKDYLEIDDKKLEKILYGIGFYKVKAKNIKKLAKIIIKDFNNHVPNTFEQLTSLPGVGRKTANCVLGYTFKIPTIAVDVHVHRISNRLGWVNTKTPEETEEGLKKIVPHESWIKVNELFVDHGQRICNPIKPRCSECKVKEFCEYGKSL